jgi:hypothetical protein
MLAGVGGYGRLLKLHKALDARRRIMVAQVAALYPVTICSSSSGKQKCPILFVTLIISRFVYGCCRFCTLAELWYSLIQRYC